MCSFLLVLDVVTPLSAFMSALLLHHACFFSPAKHPRRLIREESVSDGYDARMLEFRMDLALLSFVGMVKSSSNWKQALW
jgi:hypothetical protein